jgi:hypothetical protein
MHYYISDYTALNLLLCPKKTAQDVEALGTRVRVLHQAKQVVQTRLRENTVDSMWNILCSARGVGRTIWRLFRARKL